MDAPISFDTPTILFTEGIEEVRQAMKDEAQTELEKFCLRPQAPRHANKEDDDDKYKIRDNEIRLTFFKFLHPSLLSYSINCEIQTPLFKWLDKNIEQTKWLKFSAIGGFVASSLISTITRITCVAESFLYGSTIFLTSPFSEKKIENAKLGLQAIFFETPKNILRITVIFFEVFIDGGILDSLSCPKAYIINMSESMKVNLDHARNGTSGSTYHRDDSLKAQEVAKTRFLSYQKQIAER